MSGWTSSNRQLLFVSLWFNTCLLDEFKLGCLVDQSLPTLCVAFDCMRVCSFELLLDCCVIVSAFFVCCVIFDFRVGLWFLMSVVEIVFRCACFRVVRFCVVSSWLPVCVSVQMLLLHFRAFPCKFVQCQFTIARLFLNLLSRVVSWIACQLMLLMIVLIAEVSSLRSFVSDSLAQLLQKFFWQYVWTE